MLLQLNRTYHPEGTNGTLLIDGKEVCHTIELPWNDNQPGTSCIPEGAYLLQKRWSIKHKAHLLVTGVKGRQLILIHPANDAKKELRGCIAPVTTILAAGKGSRSRIPTDYVTKMVYEAIDNKEDAILKISKS